MKFKLAILTILTWTIASCGGEVQDASEEKLKSTLATLKSEITAGEIALKLKTDSVTLLEGQLRTLTGEELKVNLKAVEVTSMQTKTFNHFVNIHGEVEASNNVLVNPEMPGSITRIFVKEGQKVSKGQTIMSLDASIVQSNIAELQSQLAFAKTMFEKQQRLYDQNIGSEIQFLQAKNNKESLENSIKTLQSQGGKYNVYSPISGVVDEIFPNTGEGASPGMPVARIVNLSKVFVESDLSENYLGKIKNGDIVNVNFKSIGLKMKGKVVQIGQFIDENNRTFKVKIDLDEESELIKPNLLASVELIDYSNKSALSVPSKIIQEDLKGKYVYVVSEEGEDVVAKKKYVQTGVFANAFMEIKEGLEVGDLVITQGYADLAQGEKLVIQKQL